MPSDPGTGDLVAAIDAALDRVRWLADDLVHAAAELQDATGEIQTRPETVTAARSRFTAAARAHESEAAGLLELEVALAAELRRRTSRLDAIAGVLDRARHRTEVATDHILELLEQIPDESEGPEVTKEAVAPEAAALTSEPPPAFMQRSGAVVRQVTPDPIPGRRAAPRGRGGPPPRRALGARTLVIVVAAVTVVTTLAGVHSPVRVAAACAFLLVGPGLAFARLLPPSDWIVGATSAVALSLAIDTLVAEAMLLTHTWSPNAGLLVLVAITGVGFRLPRAAGRTRPATRASTS